MGWLSRKEQRPLRHGFLEHEDARDRGPRADGPFQGEVGAREEPGHADVEAESRHEAAGFFGAAQQEELFFRRHDRYRLESLGQAIEEVYSQPAVMTRYMNGLLMSQLWWANHTRALLSYEEDFLAGAAGRCLEIGPGHGLLMHLAARSGFASVEALDISAASLALTKAALGRMGEASS